MNRTRRKRTGTVMRDEARKTNQTRHRRRRKKNYTLYYILILFLIVVTGVTLSVTVFFNTSRIVVEGCNRHTPEEIVGYTGVKLGDNLFRMNLGEVRRNILDQTVDLDNVEVSRDLPDGLRITLITAKGTMAVYQGESYYIISSGGRIIEQTSDLSDYPNIVLLSGLQLESLETGSFINDSEQYQTIEKILKSAEERDLGPITSIELTDSTNIKFTYQNRITVLLGNELELEYKMDFAHQILTERVNPTEEGYVDMSIIGDFFFRPMTMATQKAQGVAVNEAAGVTIVPPEEQTTSSENTDSSAPDSQSEVVSDVSNAEE